MPNSASQQCQPTWEPWTPLTSGFRELCHNLGRSQVWDGERRDRLGREPQRDAPPASLYTSVNSLKARRRQREQNPNKVGVLHRLLPVGGVRVVELPGNHPTHQQPPVVHDGTRGASAPPEEPHRRPDLTASPRSPASQTAQ